MKKIILALILGLIALIPGDSSGFTRGGAHPAPRPAPRPAPPMHTPTFVAPRPTPRPVYHPPVRVDTPRVVQPVVRPPVVTPAHRPPVTTLPVRRPDAGFATTLPVRRPNVGFANHPVVVNRSAYVNRGIYVHRSNAYYRPGYAYYHPYYTAWHHGYWPGWYHRPWLQFGYGVGVGWLLAPGQTVVYANPYWVAPPVAPVYDYSQPIPIPQDEPIDDSAVDDSTNVYASPVPADPNVQNAQTLIDNARQAFYAKNYSGALQLIDRAVALTPKDTTVHEFRALSLFALGRYREAAATLYAVLAVAPGWDWETMRSFYPDTQTYTDQLRALEAYARANPNDGSSRFLLAYHYLVANHRDAAATTLRRVVQLQPNDQLAPHLLQMLETQEAPDRPPPGM